MLPAARYLEVELPLGRFTTTFSGHLDLISALIACCCWVNDGDLLTSYRGNLMAQVQMDEIVDHLSSEMRRALADAVREVAPEVDIDSYQLFRAFKRAVRRKCSTWETVPDGAVQAK